MAKSPFGKDTPANERAEKRGVQTGKISPKAYAKGEKSEGEKGSMKKFILQAKAMKGKK